MYPWISRTLDFGLQFSEKKCGLYMDVYGIFLCHGGKDCVRKHPSYMRSSSYFTALLQTPYFYYSKVYVLGFRQHFELDRPSNCEINRWVSCWRVFERCCFKRRSQTSSPWNGLFVWVTLGVKFSWCHLCATLLALISSRSSIYKRRKTKSCNSPAALGQVKD